MVFSYDDRSCGFFALELDPQVRSLTGIIDAAEIARRHLKAKHFSSGPNVVVVQDTDRSLIFQFHSQRVLVQSLGTKVWTESLRLLVDTLSAALGVIGADTAKRVGFRRISFVPLEMTHPELVAATFSAFVADRETLQESFGALDDVSLQLYGTRSGRKFRIGIAPQSPDDVANTFPNLMNFELFVENRFLDTTVRDFYNRIKADCLNVDVDMWQETIPLTAVSAFLEGSAPETDKLLQTGLRLIRAVPND